MAERVLSALGPAAAVAAESAAVATAAHLGLPMRAMGVRAVPVSVVVAEAVRAPRVHLFRTGSPVVMVEPARDRAARSAMWAVTAMTRAETAATGAATRAATRLAAPAAAAVSASVVAAAVDRSVVAVAAATAVAVAVAEPAMVVAAGRPSSHRML
jgi:hypothetical protein